MKRRQKKMWKTEMEERQAKNKKRKKEKLRRKQEGQKGRRNSEINKNALWGGWRKIGEKVKGIHTKSKWCNEKDEV